MLWASPILFASPCQLKLKVDHQYFHKSVFRLRQFSQKSGIYMCRPRFVRIRGGSSTQDRNPIQEIGVKDLLLATESFDPMDIDAGVPLSNRSNANLVIS
jgi:hypothetical protein